MEYMYSAMLLHSAGQEISEENITKILSAAGVEVDATRVKALTSSLEGVDIAEAIKNAASMSVAAAPAAGGAPAAAAGAAEEKKEEEEDEDEGVSEDEAAAGLGALFG